MMTWWRAWTAVTLLMISPVAHAQEPPPIGPFVVDVHATFPLFPDDLQLARSRGLNQVELPGLGLGADVGVHLYLLKWRAITFGIGGKLTLTRAHAAPPTVTGQPSFGRPVTERFTSIAPQLSFNFGSGAGWSYLSGGIGQSTWSIVPDGAAARTADAERLKTINYGGGARWFAKPHLAFSVDVRFYAIDPGSPQPAVLGSPRTTLIIAGAGISVK